MTNLKLMPFLGLALCLSLTALSGAQVAGTTASGQAKKEEPKKEEPKQDPKVAEYEKAIKDLTKIEGPFTIYQRKKDLLLELPESKLGQIFCMEAIFNTGVMGDGLQAGFPAGDFAVEAYRFERNEDNVWLVRPHLNHRWVEGDPLAVSAERSFPDAILGSFRIEQQNPEKKLLLVNVTQLFYGDSIRLSEAVQTMLGGPYMLDREKSGPESVKGFPDNTVIRMKLHFQSQGRGASQSLLAALGLGGGDQLEDPRSAPLKVTYNVWFRRDNGYLPRLYDPRVGFFTNEFFDMAKFGGDDRTERQIWRWNLKKKDPQAKSSEPLKPIVWYIDPSVPKEYRQACAQGILYWNKAFEPLGFKDAVQVKFVEDGDKDWDHADARHNVLRWTMSEDATYAIALTRTDPISGEILNAGVNLDANLLYAAFREKDRLVNPGTAFVQRSLDVLLHNDVRDNAMSAELYLLNGELPMKALEIKSKLAGLGWRTENCNYAHELTSTAAFAWDAVVASGKRVVSREQYAKEFLRDIVSHEVGHTMGLRHNFIASTNLTTTQLGDDTMTDTHSITASVMDYTPPNIVAILKGGKNYYAPCIGEYDKWAIRYGYTDFPTAKTPLAEKHFLSQIAASSGQPEHRFMTDEEADGFDPNVVRFDCAKDPLNFSAKMLEANGRVLNYAITQMPRAGESYGKRTQMIVGALTRRFREGMSMARFVGGIAGNRNFRGDVSQHATLAPVSSDLQRQAVQLIAQNCFSEKAFRLPSDVLMNLSMDVDPSFGAPGSAGWQAPLRTLIGSQENMLYSLLMSAQTTQRIAENEFKWSGKKGAYTMSEHFSTLLGAVFSEIGQNKAVPAIRRDLQRFAVNALITQAGAPPGSVSEDVRMLASDSLRRLSTRMGTQLGRTKGLDSMTVIHLRDSKASIDRFMNRGVTVSR